MIPRRTRTLPGGFDRYCASTLVATAAYRCFFALRPTDRRRPEPRVAGVSDRTLRAAFHDVVGLSPKQYAIAQRLRAAHEALLAADPKVTTVTVIATAHGFFELGQFAVRYREAFGEVPSQTLRHESPRWVAAARTGAALQATSMTAR